MNESHTYFKNLNKLDSNEYITYLEQYATEFEVPIIERDGLAYVLQILRLHKAKHILEVGTAIGYSAINFALLDPDIHVTSIERNAKMYEEAATNVENMNLHNQIDLLFEDALEVDTDGLNKMYDVIFIDAAKAQYKNFFNKYTPLLRPGGIVISDNLLFHGLLFEEVESKNLRGLTKKIKKYNEWLAEHEDFVTYFNPVGDGIAVSIKK